MTKAIPTDTDHLAVFVAIRSKPVVSVINSTHEPYGWRPGAGLRDQKACSCCEDWSSYAAHHVSLRCCPSSQCCGCSTTESTVQSTCTLQLTDTFNPSESAAGPVGKSAVAAIARSPSRRFLASQTRIVARKTPLPPDRPPPPPHPSHFPLKRQQLPPRLNHRFLHHPGAQPGTTSRNVGADPRPAPSPGPATAPQPAPSGFLPRRWPSKPPSTPAASPSRPRSRGAGASNPGPPPRPPARRFRTPPHRPSHPLEKNFFPAANHLAAPRPASPPRHANLKPR